MGMPLLYFALGSPLPYPALGMPLFYFALDSALPYPALGMPLFYFAPGNALPYPALGMPLFYIVIGNALPYPALGMPLATLPLAVPCCAFDKPMSVALQAAVEGTNFYEGYTGVALPLQKLDLMAVPGKGGAVENWGLLQMDERRLLFNEVRPYMHE